MLSGSDQNFVTGFSSQCFPVRSLANYRKIDEGGAWLVAYRAEQRRRFKAVLSNAPIAPKPAITNLHEKRQTPEPIQQRSKKLDGFYLMKKFFVEDPSDLCSVNISGKGLYNVSEDDFLLFDNVVHVDAGDNNLPFNAFRNFMSLRELELPLNNLSGAINIGQHDFLYLEKLDLSYNRLTSDDILALGVIPCLKTLHLSGNELKRLPMEMARTYRAITGVTLSGTVESEDRKIRFGLLENLFLDNNELTDVSTFSSLAGLRKLKYLNLENNEIASIPHLRLLGGRVRQKEDLNDLITKQNSVQFTSAEQPSNENGEEDEENEEEDKEGLIMNEVDEMLGMKLPGQESGEVDSGAEIKMRHRASTVTEDTTLLDDKYNPPKPFSSLLHLNLANNMVYEEEGLLAVMGWPKLKELVIWGNPLTTAFKGDPPILSFQLGKVKGMRIFRQKPSKRPKPHVNLSSFAGYRKINDALPPVPRKRDVLMLESPSKTLPISYVGPHSQPLPPISAPSGEFKSTTGHMVSPRQLNTAPSKTRHHSKNKRSRSVPPEPLNEPRPEAGEAEGEEVKTTAETTSNVDTTSTRQHQQVTTDNTDEGFFLTQIDEPEGIPETSDGAPKTIRHSRKSKHQHPDRPFSVETRYKGYEDLLDVDENDPDIIIPKDIQGSVRSLQYMLQHPLVFTDTKGVYKETPKTKVKPKTKTSRQNKVEVMGQLLDKMRVENKIIESNLENVLENFHKDKNLRKQFPEAKKLLDEVQAKYNEVRMKSLRSNAAQHEILQSAVSRDTSESIDSSMLEDDKLILEELAKFKKRIDRRL